MIIREYRPEDREGIEACIFDLQVEEYQRRPEYWATPENATKPYFDYLVKSLKDAPSNIFIAEENGKILGMVVVRIEKEDSPCIATPPYAYIPDMVVLKEFRGTGVGKQLMSKAEQFAREHGVSSIQLHVSKGNAAHGFYQHEGYEDDHQFIRMEKKLS